MHSNESGVPVDQHADYRGRCVRLESSNSSSSKGCVSCSSRASITDTIFNAMVVELITGWMRTLSFISITRLKMRLLQHELVVNGLLSCQFELIKNCIRVEDLG